eukprot:tig00021105_g18260.t1
MAGERSAKRTRAGVPAGAGVVECSIVDLPDGVLGHVLQSVSLARAWPLRAVCRRWRSVIESKAWEDVKLRSNDRADFQQLASLLRSEKVKLAARASVRLDARMGAESENNFSLVASACAVLAACNKDGSVAEADVCFVAEHRGSLDSVVHAFILGTLAALRPQRAARSALEKLSIRLQKPAPANQDEGYVARLRVQSDQQATAEDLQASLQPLSSLRSLELMPNAFPVDSAAAAAIARSLPNLQAIHFQPSDCRALAALAPLSALRDVVSCWHTFIYDTDPSEFGDAFSTLANGPAGKSLRSIVLDPDDSDKFFPIDSTCLHAIAKFPFLEEIVIDLSSDELESADLAAFKSSSLRNVSVRLDVEERLSVERLRALASAFASCPNLSSLTLDLEISYDTVDGDVHEEPDPEALSRLLRACRQFLCGLTLDVRRPLSASEAEAISLCAELKSLHVHCRIRSIAEIGPLQQLDVSLEKVPSPQFDIHIRYQDKGYESVVKQLLQDALHFAKISVVLV